MLNISTHSVSSYIDRSNFVSFKRLAEKENGKTLIIILTISFFISVLSLFLPWTQNIRSRGYVTTLNPYDKPQNIQALIGGRIDEWYVKEGDIVNPGDTVVILSEAKEDYLDPQLLYNTKTQQEAKLRSAEAYDSKLIYLNDQLSALQALQSSKLKQLDIKLAQNKLERLSLEQDLVATETYAENAKNQLARMQKMYDQGIKSLTDLESKRLSNREANAKLISIQNKLEKVQNDQLSILQEISLVKSDLSQKMSKVESEIQSADSYRNSLQADYTKLQSKFNQIQQRQNAFVITSPIQGRITKVFKNGVGEYVKAQDNIASIVPLSYKKAVELYINPNDMPLIKEGKRVRLQFDGWPAIIFSGWPDNSFGTYSAEVFAIDNDISTNGKYRILVIEDDPQKPWPDLIRIGSGARGLLLLNDVKVYYEIWRQLNGFPPDFYDPEKTKEVKNKAPLRKVK